MVFAQKGGPSCPALLHPIASPSYRPCEPRKEQAMVLDLAIGIVLIAPGAALAVAILRLGSDKP